MASCKSVFLLLLTTWITIFDFSGGSNSFQLTLGSLASRYPSSNQKYTAASPSPPSEHSLQSPVNQSIVPIVSIPLGTPPQMLSMVLDTGSQLSWVQCLYKKTKPAESAFFTSNSSTYYPLICTSTWDALCPTHDFNLGPICNKSRCQYSYFFADGTEARGNFVRDAVTFSESEKSAVVLGCTGKKDSTGADGLLGMNLGNLSFVSQLNVSKFSYCVPPRNNTVSPTSAFYLGENPNYSKNKLNYIDLITIPDAESKPNSDPNAYTVALVGIRVNGTRLNISSSVFQPDNGGSGQTIVDSGTEYTVLVDSAYEKVRERVVDSVGPANNMTCLGPLEMCFRAEPGEVANKIGDLVLEFRNGVEIWISREVVVVHMDGDGLSCVGIMNATSLSRTGSIIGNRLLSGRWVEIDVKDRVLGIGDVGACGR